MRRALALALAAAAAAAVPATAVDPVGKAVACFDEYNRIPDPEYGGSGYTQPKPTLLCVLTPKADPAAGPGWPVTCVTDNVSTTPPRVEAYWLITCVAPILP